MENFLGKLVPAVLVCCAIVGCNTSAMIRTGAGQPVQGATKKSAKLSPEAALQRLAKMNSRDWSTGVLNNRELKALQRQQAHIMSKGELAKLTPKPGGNLPMGQAKPYDLQLYSTIGSTGISTSIAAQPSFDGNGHAYWIAPDLKVYQWDSGVSNPFDIVDLDEDEFSTPIADTFPDSDTITAIDSIGHTLLFACSAEARFFIIDATAGTIDKTYQMTGSETGIADVANTPAPFIDWVGSAAGEANVYAVTNNGKLHKFVVNLTTHAISSTDIMPLPNATVLSRKEYYKASPVVIDDTLTVGTFRRHTSGNAALAQGRIYKFDVSTLDSNAVPPVIPNTPTKTINLSKPCLIAPSLDVEYPSWDSKYAFVPNGYHITMVNLDTGASKDSNELVVNDADFDSGDLTGVTVDGSKMIVGGGILSRVVVDAWDPFQVYVVTSNALWKVSYASGTYDSTDPYDPDAWDERTVSFFDDATLTTYCKTHFGEDNTEDSAIPSKYICNISNPCVYLDDETVFVIDSNGNSNNSTATSYNAFSLNRNSQTTPPALDDFSVLNDSTAATHMGGQFISYDYLSWPVNLVFSTRSNTGDTPAARLWAANP